ncbi:3821_t:CDS:2, partial [Diversispora eburnea]
MESHCPFCVEILPDPLPKKIWNILRKISNQNGQPTSGCILTSRLISHDKGGITLEAARKIMEDNSTF